MMYRRLPTRFSPLTDDELEERRQALKYVSEHLNQPAWRRDPIARHVLMRERDHALNELIYGRHLPFTWRPHELFV